MELNCPDQHLSALAIDRSNLLTLKPQGHLVQSMSPCWTNQNSFTPKSLCVPLRRVFTDRKPTSVTRAFGAAS